MKIKKFLVVTDENGAEISNRELVISESKLKEIVGISEFRKAPYVYQLQASQRVRMASFLKEAIENYYISIHWREVPESDKERADLIRNNINEARAFFPPNDNEIYEWLMTTCKTEWCFGKHLQQGNFLLAVEELHVMTQVFYGSPFNDSIITQKLNEARRLIAEKV